MARCLEHSSTCPAQDGNLAWAPDGNRIYFTSVRRGFRNICSIDSQGRETEKPLIESDTDKYLNSASVDGHWLIFSSWPNSDLWLLPLTGERNPQPLLATEPTENFGQISRDGRWLVYQSNESGKMEVYVTTFPRPSWKRRVSQNGGILPRWSADGREVFYLDQDHSNLFAAAVSAEGATFRVSDAQRLFSRQMVAGRGYPYDVTADGRRFLVVASSGAAPSPLTLVLNWDADLKR
jgi:eukaryotic-like serine/threonine-protein kinase